MNKSKRKKYAHFFLFLKKKTPHRAGDIHIFKKTKILFKFFLKEKQVLFYTFFIFYFVFFFKFFNCFPFFFNYCFFFILFFCDFAKKKSICDMQQHTAINKVQKKNKQRLLLDA